MRPPIRANILKVSPYLPGKPIEEVQRELGLTNVVKLASNENPLGPSPKAIHAVQDAANRMNVYPDGLAFTLKAAISKKFNVEPDQIMLGNGSDELIHLLAFLFLESENDQVIMATPGFARYMSAALLAPSKLIQVPLNSNMVHDLPAMAKKLSNHTKLVFIANPHNPTGTIITKTDFDHFLSDLPPKATVVLDEAYAEFAADQPDFPNSLHYVLEGKPVVGLRTFSKSYGLAGIRIGYGFAHPDIVDAYHRAREPFNVNLLAQTAAVAALSDESFLNDSIRHNSYGVKRLTEFFASQGCHPYPSFANFVLVDAHRPATKVFKELLAEGVIVRDATSFGLPNCIRVSVGTGDEMDAFEQAFLRVLSGNVVTRGVIK